MEAFLTMNQFKGKVMNQETKLIIGAFVLIAGFAAYKYYGKSEAVRESETAEENYNSACGCGK